MSLSKFLVRFCAIFLIAGIAHADPQSEAIRKQAEVNAAAVQKGDYETIIKNTHPKLVELLGGKEQMLSVIKSSMDGMHSRGMKISAITIGEPQKIITSGDKLYSIVPMTMVITAPEAKISQNSYLLAISSDKGVTWTLLDGSGIDSEVILKVIPDFPSDFKLPEKEDPQIDPIKPATP